MSLHTELRIHTAAKKLLSVLTESTLQMRRDAKRPIGERMIVECLDITTLIQRANIATDKAPHLDAVLEKKCRIEALLLDALDKKLISHGRYSIAAEQSVNIGKQAIAWRNSSGRRPLHDRQGGHASA